MAQVQEDELRAQAFDVAIKQLAERQYKFKQALTISTTNAWLNTFYRETTTAALEGQTGNLVRGAPRLAQPATNVVEWSQIDTYPDKYFFESKIAWEDVITDAIDVQGRTAFRVAEAITKSVDDRIYTVLTDTAAESTINVIQIATGNYWDGNSAAIIDDLGQARQLIAEDEYDTSSLLCFLSPKDHRSVITYLAGKGAQFPKLGEEVTTNGRIGSLMGITFVIANSVTVSQALIVVPKLCATWKQAQALTTETTRNGFVSLNIRAVEIGVTQVTDPKAMCLILGTQGSF